MIRIYTTLIWVLILLPALSFATSEITLKNGDRLSGKIVEETDDAVVIETIYAGKVKVVRSHIAKIAATELEAPKADVPRETGSGATVKDPLEAEAVPPIAPPIKRRNPFVEGFDKIMGNWDGNAHLGFSYTAGNSNNITMTSGLRATRANPKGGTIVYFRSLWNNAHSAGLTTQNAFWGGARYDRNVTTKMFGFISYDFERDKPRRLDFRSVVGGGVGHRTIKKDRTELELLTGVAWNRTWQAGDDFDRAEGLAGLTFKQKLNSRLRLQNTFTYFQNFNVGPEYRLIFDSSINVDVTPRIGVYLAVGDRFNNAPLGVAKKNDFLLTTGMRWNFGKKK